MSGVLPDLHTWAQELQALAASVAETFSGPEDDWVPVCFAVDRDSQTQILGLSPADMTPERKPVVFAGLVVLLRELGADRVALLISTWQATVPEGVTDVNTWRASLPASMADWPEDARQEALALTYADVSGEFMALAPIERHPDRPPTLGAWQVGEWFAGGLRDLLREVVA